MCQVLGASTQIVYYVRIQSDSNKERALRKRVAFHNEKEVQLKLPMTLDKNNTGFVVSNFFIPLSQCLFSQGSRYLKILFILFIFCSSNC